MKIFLWCRLESESMVLKVFAAIIALIGLILVFDARRIVRKSFQNVDENATVLGCKIFGTLVAILGGILMII